MAACWLPIPLVMACFLVFPCNAIGYSPQLYQIVYIRKFLRLDPRHARISNRDIRFFVQTAVQNVIMVAAAVAIVVANNEHHLEGDIIHIFGFNTLLFKHVNNGLALLIFNPEVRKKLRGSVYVTSSVFPSSSRGNLAPSSGTL
ncbi:hypothetical protein QR680_015993 [Steinernema hermaphroditum]|uniref:7TM GPCR serpentine receptor class x (Srx) domain-containing protein n=1 Tax=Steinernema hermaphroditum TaxID=289476 RepID=A0AA39H9N6_9BILA|nr:hypothetical protein QR680_015993 [Steinernema hermaphroditum]